MGSPEAASTTRMSAELYRRRVIVKSVVVVWSLVSVMFAPTAPSQSTWFGGSTLTYPGGGAVDGGMGAGGDGGVAVAGPERHIREAGAAGGVGRQREQPGRGHIHQGVAHRQPGGRVADAHVDRSGALRHERLGHGGGAVG